MLFKVNEKGFLVFTQSLDDLKINNETAYWELLIFASLFAFMLKDCFLFYDTIDILFTLHHFAVMLFMFCLYFTTHIAGITALALCCVVAEIGTSTYCAYMIWNYKKIYTVMMSLSNLLFLIIITTVTYNQDYNKEFPKLLITLYALGVIVIIGRQTVLLNEVHYKEK